MNIEILGKINNINDISSYLPAIKFEDK
jgi:hypothetical protein